MSEGTQQSPFSADQRRALVCVLDRIIPPSADAKMPGAGELGLADHIEQVLRKTPDLLSTITDGLEAADERAAGSGEKAFERLPDSERSRVLAELSTTHPGFLPSLIFHTYVGYYQHPTVVAALGMETHPPYPTGFPMEPGDLTLLDGVKQRTQMYRDA